MPTVIRRSSQTTLQGRRDVLQAVSWNRRSSLWNPPTDVYETDDAYVVRVEIAGMREEDFEVAFENKILVITGSRPDRSERRAYHQMEIQSGKFATAVGLAAPVEVETATAEYAEGFLTIRLPKAKPNSVKVD